MNADLPNSHASIHYYDGDYPSVHTTLFQENFDEITKYQGIACDIERYLELAEFARAPILELCCGTGRIAIPLARAGHSVVGVDVSSGMLAQFRSKLEREAEGVRDRILLREANVAALDLDANTHDLAILGFNSLLCVPDFKDQRSVLDSVARHLVPGGMVAIDIVNPLRLKLEGDAVPKPFFTRRNPNNGHLYTRFAMSEPMDSEHRQRLHGWYDELDGDGTVRRQFYSLVWRPIFRFEIDLMLEISGFEIVSIEGGHEHEPYTAQSPRMFILARRRA